MKKYCLRYLSLIVVLFSVGMLVVTGCSTGQQSTGETSTQRAPEARLLASLPDLTISSLTCPPTAVRAGRMITNSYTVQNIGSVLALGTTTHFWLSSSGTSTNGATKIKNHAIPGIAAGGSFPSSPTMTLPAGVTGNKFIVAVADGTGTLAEANEGNNLASCAITINP